MTRLTQIRSLATAASSPSSGAMPRWTPTHESLTDDAEASDRLAFAFHIAGHHWHSYNTGVRSTAVEFSPQRPSRGIEFGSVSTATAMVAVAAALERTSASLRAGPSSAWAP